MRKGPAPKQASCHPDRKHWARGMCKQCYTKYKNSIRFLSVGRKKRTPECGHPERRHVGHGKCPACYAKWKRETDPKYGKEQRRIDERRRKYGISESEFRSLIKKQHGLCALCHSMLDDGGPKTHVDHCHKTGIIRGLLCFTCNKALGMLGDGDTGIGRALCYVKRRRDARLPEPPF